MRIKSILRKLRSRTCKTFLPIEDDFDRAVIGELQNRLLFEIEDQIIALEDVLENQLIDGFLYDYKEL